jgi:hypothetical protein
MLLTLGKWTEDGHSGWLNCCLERNTPSTSKEMGKSSDGLNEDVQPPSTPCVHNPHKHILFKPSFGQLLSFISVAFQVYCLECGEYTSKLTLDDRK